MKTNKILEMLEKKQSKISLKKFLHRNELACLNCWLALGDFEKKFIRMEMNGTGENYSRIILFTELFAKYSCTNCQEDIIGVRVHCADCVDFELCPQVSVRAPMLCLHYINCIR